MEYILVTSFNQVLVVTVLGKQVREALEARCETYTLIKLAPWPARRWKCHYRLMMGDGIYDAQTVAEAYALGLLALLGQHR